MIKEHLILNTLYQIFPLLKRLLTKNARRHLFIKLPYKQNKVSQVAPRQNLHLTSYIQLIISFTSVVLIRLISLIVYDIRYKLFENFTLGKT